MVVIDKKYGTYSDSRFSNKSGTTREGILSNSLVSNGEILTGVTSSQRSNCVTSEHPTKYEMLESLENLKHSHCEYSKS